METTGRTLPSIGDGKGNLAASIDKAAATTHEAIQRVTDSARPAVDHMATGAHQAVDKVADLAAQTSATLDSKGAQLQDVQARLMEECTTYVRSNPLAALGIAAAAGFILSRVISSR